MPIEKFDIEKFIHEAEFDYFRFYLDFCRGFKNNEDMESKGGEMTKVLVNTQAFKKNAKIT